ncbi:MAG: sulfotransferase domain-containing protein [Gammaproteobacteria bacterium]|nr:sulfotransferase domain-containing protein [Gammaproteobacteria bacterium]
MHQSGTHWLKHMLATALTHKLGLSPPQYIHANDVIAGPKDPLANDRLPHIVSSHSIPHALLGSQLFRHLLRFPPYIVLVRDIRASLVANYEKWKDQYDCEFPVYLQGDISGHRFNSDIWWCLRFCNRWGYLAKHFPDSTLIVKYEDLKSRPLKELQRIVNYWQLELDDSTLRYAIAESSKEKMSLKKDPDTPFGVTVVRNSRRSYMTWYDKEQLEYVHDTCDRFLKFNFDYDYKN